MTISVLSLFSTSTVAEIYARALELAAALGLPTTSWRTGDPTKSTYWVLANILATQDSVVAEYIKSGFLSSASGDWLKVLAEEVYGVVPEEATAATLTVTLTNSGGGHYEPEAGDIRLKASGSGQTYKSTSGGTLSAGAVVTFNFEADEAGSDGSVGVGEIDEFVTPLIGVVITSNTAGVGTDAQSDDFIKDQCKATLGALSPNGPPDAFEYVARSSTLTGVSDITRAKSTGDGGTGGVTVYVAGSSGPVAPESVVAAQAAIDLWSTPLTVTPTVYNTTAVTVAVTATITGVSIPADFLTKIQTQLGQFFAALDIGEDVATSAILAEIHAAVPEVQSVAMSLPAGATVIAASQVAVLGTVTVVEA